MEKRFFWTFEESSVVTLNNKIYDFCMNNNCEEVSRSAPTIAIYDGCVQVLVTSEFKSKSE